MCRAALLIVFTAWASMPALAEAQTFGGGVFTSKASRGTGGGSVTLPSSLVGVGDSIMNGYGVPSPLVTAVEALGAGAYAINAGYPGENTAQISERWLASEATVCGATRCSHVWFEGGVNDLRLTSTLPPAMIANMLTAVDDALAKGYVVVWSDILPCRGDAQCTAPVAGNILTYNALMATACATAPRSLNPRLRCVFAYSAFDNPASPGYLLPAYSRDELHLSVSGSEALGALAGVALED